MYPSFGRGSGGRGQSNQYWSRFSTRGFNPTSEPELPPKGTLIETLKLASLKEDFEKATADESHSPKIKDVQFVASYNWVANQRGRIIIPGRILKYLSLPFDIELDIRTCHANCI